MLEDNIWLENFITNYKKSLSNQYYNVRQAFESIDVEFEEQEGTLMMYASFKRFLKDKDSFEEEYDIFISLFNDAKILLTPG